MFYHEKEREPADFHGGSKWAKMLRWVFTHTPLILIQLSLILLYSGGVVVFRRRSRGESSSSAYTGALSQSLDASGNPMGMEMGVLHPNEHIQSPYGEQVFANDYGGGHRDRLVKQTYSVLVRLPKDRGGLEIRKWHMSKLFSVALFNMKMLMISLSYHFSFHLSTI